MLSLLIGSAGYAQKVISQDTYKRVYIGFIPKGGNRGYYCFLYPERAKPYLTPPVSMEIGPYFHEYPDGTAEIGQLFPPKIYLTEVAAAEMLRIVVEAIGLDVIELGRSQNWRTDEISQRTFGWSNAWDYSDLAVVLISDMSGRVMHVTLEHRDEQDLDISPLALSQIEMMVRQRPNIRVQFNPRDKRLKGITYLHCIQKYSALQLYAQLLSLTHDPNSRHYGRYEEYREVGKEAYTLLQKKTRS